MCLFGVIYVQKLVSFSVDDFVVNGVKQRVLFASSDAVKKVSVIKTLGSFGRSVASAVGLTAAVYASAGTSHDLDKVEVLACLDSFKKVVCVSKTAYYGDLELLLTVGKGKLLDTLAASLTCVGNAEKGGSALVGGYSSENSLGHAACYTKDNAGTGGGSEGHINSLGLKLIEDDTRLLYHKDKLLGGDDRIYVSAELGLELCSVSLELLSCAGHYSYVEHLLVGIFALILKNGCHHLHGRTAGGNVGQKFGMLFLAELNPAGAAGGYKGKVLVFLHAREKFFGLFDYCKIGTESRIINLVKAHTAESRNDLAEYVLAVLYVKLLAYCNANCGSDLNGSLDLGVVDGTPNLAYVIFNNDSTCGANGSALTAAYAGGFCKGHTECCTDSHIGSAVSEINSANVLDLVTNSYAVTAKDALACVAGNANGGRILALGGFCAVGEANAFNVKAHSKILKLALVVVFANRTVAAVVCKKQLKDVLAVAAKLFGVCFYRSACLGGSRASSLKATPLVLNHTHTARAVHGELGVIAEGGHFYADLTAKLQNILFTFDLYGNSVDRHIFLITHFKPP